MNPSKVNCKVICSYEMNLQNNDSGRQLQLSQEYSKTTKNESKEF
jgi:hypothetical protein